MDTGRIAAIPFFADLPEPELEAVAAAAFELELEAGQTVALKGDFGHALFAVESGTADVSADGEQLGTVGPGDIVGEVAVLTSGRRTASVIATSPMCLVGLFKRDVWALQRTAPEVAGRLHAAVGEHLGTTPA